MDNWWGGWSFLWEKGPWREATTHSHRLPRRSMSKAITRSPAYLHGLCRDKFTFVCQQIMSRLTNSYYMESCWTSFVLNTQNSVWTFIVSAKLLEFEGKYSFLGIFYPFFLSIRFSIFDRSYIRISSVSICNSSILNSAAWTELHVRASGT
jgi:hypothetical protein